MDIKRLFNIILGLLCAAVLAVLFLAPLLINETDF